MITTARITSDESRFLQRVNAVNYLHIFKKIKGQPVRIHVPPITASDDACSCTTWWEVFKEDADRLGMTLSSGRPCHLCQHTLDID
jgi:hypothetical protein